MSDNLQLILRAVQEFDISVSRATELIEIDQEGKFNYDLLPYGAGTQAIFGFDEVPVQKYKELLAERDALAADLANQRARALSECDRCPHDINNQKLLEERDALAAKLAELEGQEPVAWMTANREMTSFVNFHDDDLPLYARPVPAEMSPEFTDTARSALLWVLWHHQGGSSPVGQPIRYALGMGAHEHLSANRVQEAKRWAALAKAESNDFRRGCPSTHRAATRAMNSPRLSLRSRG